MLKGKYRISLYCPEMKILPINRRLKRTAEEPMTFRLYDQDGSILRTVENVIIPETLVRKIGLTPLHWKVDACIGQDVDKTVVCELPEEDVVFSLQESLKSGSIVVIAKQMVANTTVVIDGSTATGIVIFPDCKVDVFHGGAEALTATGEVTFA